MQTPTPFLEVRVHQLDPLPGIIGLCAGYELGEWRERAFAKHLMRWLPEFALKHTEIANLGSHNAVDLVARAAKSVYATEKYGRRGEFGELLLHVALRQCFSTLPAISKLFYKDARNDTVKGFDAVHVVATSEVLELWLGEAKFYNEFTRAMSDVLDELQKHTRSDYLRDEFTAIVNKIDDNWPHAQRLKGLIDPQTSLDKIFDAACIPVLLTYDSDVVRSFAEASAHYEAAFSTEVLEHHDDFKRRLDAVELPRQIRVHLFLLPLKDKKSFVSTVHDALVRVQEIQ